jgi:hypothetical protein
MRVDVLLILFSLVGATGAESSGSPAQRHHLQEVQPRSQTLNYRANYSADFQHYSDVLCDGEAPVLVVHCFGRNMTILNTSDESIMCKEMEEPVIENGTSYECRNTCVDADCQGIYRYKDSFFDPIGGPFGSIFFMCEGDTWEQVDAVFIFRGGTTNGTCAASASSTASGRNYHVGRLGISCPIGSGPNREYVYDDTYADCISLGSFTLDLANNDDPNDILGCVSGMPCEGQQCSFPFLNFWLEAILGHFL